MAKMKGSFGVKVSSGSSAGFSNIPGASSYSVTFGKQFADKFGKAYGAAKKKKKTGEVIQDPPKGDTVPSSEPTKIQDPVKTPAPAKASSARLGGFKVDSGKPGGIGQVKSTSRKITLEEIQDPKSKTKRPIEPENIPDSYKPQGDAPSSRQWSEADKAALESERPSSYVPPDFKAEADSPEAGAARLKALDDEVGAASKARREAKATSTAKPAPRPKKSTTPPAGNRGQQFSDTSSMPAVNLDAVEGGNDIDEKTGPVNPAGKPAGKVASPTKPIF